MENKNQLNRTDYVSAILLAIACCVFLVTAVSCRESRVAAWESRAKGTLRAIGSSELAYQSGNNRKAYGSFQAMVDSQAIARGYTLGNMIESYSLTWDVHNPYTVPDGNFPVRSMSTFTVIAWPIVSRPDYLHTFGITEDQVVRVYDPKMPNVKLDDVHTWDPIL